MDRRTALAAAGAVALTVTAGVAAVAANLDMLGAQDDRLGELQPVAPVGAPSDPLPVEVETIVVDVPPPSAGAASQGGPSGAASQGGPSGAAAAAVQPAEPPVYDDAYEDEYDDSEDEDSEQEDSEDDWYERGEDEEHDEDHEDDEYEGHDDDD